MNTDLEKARNHLDSGDYTCVLCHGDTIHTATERGVKPLLSWLDSGVDALGFSAADRVVGRATAYLYVLLGVKAVYARVMSYPAREVLEKAGITTQAEKLVEGIINRKGTGPCPFEAAVLTIDTPEEALEAIRWKMAQMHSAADTPPSAAH